MSRGQGQETFYLSFHSKFSQELVIKHLPNGLHPDSDIGFLKSLNPITRSDLFTVLSYADLFLRFSNESVMRLKLVYLR